MEPKSGFVIDDKPYAIPKLDTINLDEERILYIYADTVLQDFAPIHPEAPDEERIAYESLQTRKIRNPDFKRALAHIAYRREHPDLSDADIQEAIGQVNALEVDLALIRGDDDSPPAQSSQSEPESKSDSSELLSQSDSGSPIESDSAQVVVIHSPTGTIESATSSPPLAQAIPG